MKLVYAVMTVSIAISCSKPRSEEIATLKSIYIRKAPEVIRLAERLKFAVEETGNRPRDLKLLSQVNSIIRIRQQSGIYFNRHTLSRTDIKPDKVTTLIDSMESYAKRFEIYSELQNPLKWGEFFLASYVQNKNYVDYLNCLINLQTVEYELLEQLNRQLSICGPFYTLDFYLNSNTDTIPKGAEYKMIISLKPQIFLDSWEIIIDSLSLHMEDAVVAEPYEFSTIGTAGYFSFRANNPGNYTFTGNYKMLYQSEGFEFKERFSKSFVVLE